MMWRKFSDTKPEEGIKLITRHPGREIASEAFETWHNWKKDDLKTTFSEGRGNITHWWDGEPDFDLAVNMWFVCNSRCTLCGNDLEKCIENYPCSPENWICNNCDSTYSINDDTISQQ